MCAARTRTGPVIPGVGPVRDVLARPSIELTPAASNVQRKGIEGVKHDGLTNKNRTETCAEDPVRWHMEWMWLKKANKRSMKGSGAPRRASKQQVLLGASL